MHKTTNCRPKDWNGFLNNFHVQSFTPDGRCHLYGIAIHNNEVYMTSHGTSGILVYSFQNLSTVSRQISVSGLIYKPFQHKQTFYTFRLTVARGLVSSESDSCLYVSNHCPGHIYRINTHDDTVTDWATHNNSPGGLSITKQNNLLVSYADCGQIDEFSDSGQLIRTIKLSDGITGIHHAIELETGEFIVCQLDPEHRICLVDPSGKLIKSYGQEQGSGVGQFDCPYHVELDQKGNILVSDCDNHKLRVLTSDLEHVADVNITDRQFREPTCTCWDKGNDRLLVTTYSGCFYMITPQNS